MLKLTSLALAILLPVTAVSAQSTAKLSVLHGIPGLAKDVDVFANGSKLFSFGYGDFKGPLSLKPGTYKLEVKLDGKTVLSASPKVEGGKNYTVVAHLKEKSGIALSAFVNNTGDISRYNSRLYVRHVANAPAVDVYAKRWWRYSRIFKSVSNGQGGSVDVSSGTYYVKLTAAGSSKTAFGPAKLSLSRGKVYAVYAIGELGKTSFRLFVQTITPEVTLPKLNTFVRGKSCGGTLSLSTKSVAFDKKFDVVLTGGTKNGYGFLHAGNSDSRFLILRLPLNLGYLGASGCYLYQNTPWVMPVRLDKDGGTKVTTMISSKWASYFREIHYQYSFVTPRSSSNRLGLKLTNYASVEKD